MVIEAELHAWMHWTSAGASIVVFMAAIIGLSMAIATFRRKWIAEAEARAARKAERVAARLAARGASGGTGESGECCDRVASLMQIGLAMLFGLVVMGIIALLLYLFHAL